MKIQLFNQIENDDARGRMLETQSAYGSHNVELKESSGKLFVEKLFTRRFIVKASPKRRDEKGCLRSDNKNKDKNQ